jgi:DNA-binding LytR/AlgR family response regulator
MMMDCIAIDDEPLALKLLEDNISKVPYLNLVARCEDAFEATRVLQSRKIDLVFTDIQMPGLTGLQFIEGLTHRPIAILITAYRQYAVESYNLDVVDYLVKPVALDRFMKACNKALELFQLRSYANNGTQPRPDYLFVNVGYSLQKVVFEDILYVEGLRYYIHIHLKSTPKPVLTRMTMKAIEELLGEGNFLRIHKSFLISMRHVAALQKNSVVMENSVELPIGDTYREAVMVRIRGKS